MDGAALADLSRAFLRRVFASDFLSPTTRDDERAVLAAAAPPVAAAQPQDYLAWRRAALWVAALLLALGLLLALIDHRPVAEAFASGQAEANGQTLSGAELEQAARQAEEQLGKTNVEVIDNLAYFNLTVKALVAVLALLAARQWTSVLRSRRYARWAWMCAIVLPLGIAAFPWSSVLDFSHLDRQGIGGAQQLKLLFGFLFAVQTLITIAPKLLAMFPGIMRAALTVKTLLPEASAPGWLTVLFAPLYAGFMLLPMAVLSQMQGNLALIGAFALLALAPATYLQRAKELARPHTADEAGRLVRGIRKGALLCNLGGVGLLLYYLIDLDALPVLTALHVLFEGLGGVLLTMVVFADVMLALLRFSCEQTRQFRGSPLEQQYDQRWAAFDQSALTDVNAAFGIGELGQLRKRLKGELPPPPPAAPTPPAAPPPAAP